uniref:Putative tudor domain-containing protein 7 n=1 Tax=Culex tarsalis TaxID=7177 RepID=A0A1Q3F7N2_CULTA
MANSPKKFSEEADAAVSVLRAIVTSKKGASTVRSVLADFRELEGGPLMYTKFGFPNADEFLKATGEFVVQSRMGESVVFAKHSQASAHIQKMVSAQRSTKTKKSGFAVLRQPQKRTTGNGSNWNPSAYNKMYPRVPYPVQKYPQHQQYSSYPRNNAKYPQGPPGKFPYNNQPKPLMSLKVAPPAQNTQTNRTEANNNSSAAKNLNRATQQQQGPLPNNDLRHRLNDKTPFPPQQRQLSSLELKNRTNQQQKDLSPTNIINKDRPHDAVAYNTSPAVASSPRSVNARLQQVNKDSVRPYEAPPVSASNGVGQPRQEPARTIRPPPPQQMILTPPSTPLAQLPTLPGKSLQDRLKKNQQVDSVDLEKAAKVITLQTTPPRVPELKAQTSVPSHPLTPPATNSAAKEPFSWNDPNATPVELLVQYAQQNGFSRPIYKYLRLKNQRFQCRVTVNGSTYSTYPADYANEFECQFAAARTAIENIKRDEKRNNYSVCLESDFEIANKLYELLLNCPTGMFSKKIPDAFLEAHQSLLPENWESEIMLSRPRMFYKEEVSQQALIYFAVVGENGSSESDGSITSEAKIMSVNLVELPWEEQYWNLYVTNPVSTVEIWARLVGPAHSDRMDALSTDIELEMMDDSKKQKPNSVSAGEFYLLPIMDCWHRIRVVEVDYETNNAVCFFIDLGDQEKVAIDEIYVCDPRFLELPAQSVCFTLDKLEDFGENPKARPHLDNLICGKVCIGHVISIKEDYESFNTIKMVFYDTSSDDDVNLNEILLKNICEDTPVPELQRKGVTTVMITFVDDEGNVYCQLKDTAMTYIQKLINNLVQSGALEDNHRGLYQSSNEHQLFLVRDEEDHKYYRAVKESKEVGSSVSVLYIDYGVRKTVQAANLYRLQTLSVALSRYPAQAIRTKLFDLPEVNEYLLSRLRALLKPGLTAMVKVGALSVLPLVKIYLHYGPNNILVCLNDSIRAEMELEINSEEVICDPRIAASDTNSSISSTASSARTQFSSPVPSQVVPRLTKCPLPRVGDLFDVTVTIASSPNYFIVQPYRHAKELNTLMVDLQTYCKGPGAQMVAPDSVQQGEVYAGFDSDDGNWYRVLVVNILCGPTLIHVYFCDFGQIKMLDSKLLRVLPQQLRNLLPQQAVKAKLYGVQPRHGDWSTEDAVRFQQLTEGKKFASYIRSIQADEFNPNDDIVELELIDVSTSEDIIICMQLVDEGRAVLTNK